MRRQIRSERTRIAIALSGTGRTFENLLDYEKRPDASFQIGAVVSSSRSCAGFLAAARRSLPTLVGDFHDMNPLGDAAKYLEGWLDNKRISLIALAGFLKKFPCFPGWEQRIINIHPARLPDFGGRGLYGRKVHEAVLAAGAKYSGATVHFVNGEYDAGKIIARSKVAVRDNDNFETLGARVFASEVELYPRVLDRLIRGQLPLMNGEIWEYKDS